MKIIGEAGSGKYICEVTHSEIEKFFNLYYGKLGNVTVGKEINLGKGYDFAADCKNAMRATAELIEKNKNVIEAIFNGIQIFANREDGEVGK